MKNIRPGLLVSGYRISHAGTGTLDQACWYGNIRPGLLVLGYRIRHVGTGTLDQECWYGNI